MGRGRIYEDIAPLFQATPWPVGMEDRQQFHYQNHEHGRDERRTCERLEVAKGGWQQHVSYGITRLRRSRADAELLETLARAPEH